MNHIVFSMHAFHSNNFFGKKFSAQNMCKINPKWSYEE